MVGLKKSYLAKNLGSRHSLWRNAGGAVAYALIIISLALALIGSYTKTFKDEERRTLTPWGKVVGVLLLASAGLAGFERYSEQEENRFAKQAADRDRDDLKSALTQQRLIAVGALGSVFDLVRPPILVFGFEPEVSIQSAEYGKVFKALEDFPSFGKKIDGYRVGLYLNEERSFEYSKGAVPASDVHAIAMEHSPDPLPRGMFHVFPTSQYRSLDEVVLDFRPGRNVGRLTLWGIDNFSALEKQRIIERLTTGAETYVQVDIERARSNLAYAHLKIPIRIVTTASPADELLFDFITGDAELTASDYGP